MKHFLLTTIAAVLLVGCGESQQSASGADVNAKDRYGATPLLYAAKKETAELLITNGADVNAKDVLEETPLDYAKGKTADLLRKHGGKTREELKAA